VNLLLHLNTSLYYQKINNKIQKYYKNWPKTSPTASAKAENPSTGRCCHFLVSSCYLCAISECLKRGTPFLSRLDLCPPTSTAKMVHKFPGPVPKSMQLVSIFRMFVLSVAIIYTFQSSSFSSVFSLFNVGFASWACFIGVCFTSDVGTRNGNFSFQYISASRAQIHCEKSLHMQIMCITSWMGGTGFGFGFAFKWKTNKGIVLERDESENIHSITNMRVIATIKGYNKTMTRTRTQNSYKKSPAKCFKNCQRHNFPFHVFLFCLLLRNVTQYSDFILRRALG